MHWGFGNCARRYGLALIGGVLLTVVTGCGSSSNTTPTSSSGSHASFYTGGTPGGTPVRGGRIVIDQAEVPTTMDPLASVVTGNNDAILQVSEGLVQTVPGSKEVQPDLATSWTLSSDEKTYTFHIREGVKFSSGEPLTGEDVVYSIERWKLPISSYGSILWPHVKRVYLSGPMTVELQLKQPFPSIVQDLAFAPLAIVSKKAVESEGEKAFALHPVGTGPFVLKNSTPGYTTMDMVRNPHYWRAGQPYVDELVYNQVLEANARILAVRSGAATIGLSAPFSQVASLKSTPGVKLLIEELSSSSCAFFNDAQAPFNEVNVRKALNYATPSEQIIKTVFKGLGTPSNDFPTNQFKYYDSTVPSFSYDIAKAKALLKDSKVPNGFSTSILIYGGEPNSTLIASILQSAWAQIGVHLSIQSAEPTTFESNLTKGNYQIALYTPELIVPENYVPDLDSFYYTGDPGTGSYFKSPRVTPLVEKATATPNETVRAKLFAEVQRIANWEEAAFLNIAYVPQLNLVSNSLRGFTYQPNSYYHMGEAWLAQ
jgi:peptide/nickel transport system substrate-binding protein